MMVCHVKLFFFSFQIDEEFRRMYPNHTPFLPKLKELVPAILKYAQQHKKSVFKTTEIIANGKYCTVPCYALSDCFTC